LAATNKIAIMEAGAVTAFGESQDIFERYLSLPQVTERESAPAGAELAPQAAGAVVARHTDRPAP
jgi:ATP-binding cassette, subfamily C, type I secretion system permease/ATPase